MGANANPNVKGIDADLSWLLAHVPPGDAPNMHLNRVDELEKLLHKLIRKSELPFTIGLFGGWGSGKTTFLSVLANNLLKPQWLGQCKIVYFNAWKYGGFMEIVPALIYKILRHGNHAQQSPDKIIANIMISLGKDYSDRIGEWAETNFGLNPVKIFRDIQSVAGAVKDNIKVPERLILQYYTQVDQAQDLLNTVFSDQTRCTVVLIDELDRCDPDEAFAVIKQLRIFFAMRRLPICFVLSANPEPIGLAIKHRYGLNTPGGDFEARRILEKFVDTYIDLSEPSSLGYLVPWLWQLQGLDVTNAALVIELDQYVENVLNMDTVRNATALQAMCTDNSLYCNLCLLDKSLRYVCQREFANKHLIWTAWHLEIAEQMDPLFRRNLARIAGDIQWISMRAIESLLTGSMEWRNGRLKLNETPQGTTFGVYRGHFWDFTRRRLAEKEREQGADVRDAVRILNEFLSDYRKMDFLIMTSLLPANYVGRIEDVSFDSLRSRLLELEQQFGWLLANY
jgi:hypothetical protein